MRSKGTFTQDVTTSVTGAQHATACLAERQERSHGRQLSHVTAYNPYISSFWGRCSSKKTEATAHDSMCRAAILSSNLNCRPGLQQYGVWCEQACRHVNTAVVFLCFYFATRQSHCNRAACRLPYKHSFRCRISFIICMIIYFSLCFIQYCVTGLCYDSHPTEYLGENWPRYLMDISVQIPRYLNVVMERSLCILKPLHAWWASWCDLLSWEQQV